MGELCEAVTVGYIRETACDLISTLSGIWLQKQSSYLLSHGFEG